MKVTLDLSLELPDYSWAESSSYNLMSNNKFYSSSLTVWTPFHFSGQKKVHIREAKNLGLPLSWPVTSSVIAGLGKWWSAGFTAGIRETGFGLIILPGCP